MHHLSNIYVVRVYAIHTARGGWARDRAQMGSGFVTWLAGCNIAPKWWTHIFACIFSRTFYKIFAVFRPLITHKILGCIVPFSPWDQSNRKQRKKYTKIRQKNKRQRRERENNNTKPEGNFEERCVLHRRTARTIPRTAQHINKCVTYIWRIFDKNNWPQIVLDCRFCATATSNPFSPCSSCSHSFFMRRQATKRDGHKEEEKKSGCHKNKTK